MKTGFQILATKIHKGAQRLKKMQKVKNLVKISNIFS